MAYLDDADIDESLQELKPKRDPYVILPHHVATASDYLYKKLISMKAERQTKVGN
jgi:hypothetical protein